MHRNHVEVFSVRKNKRNNFWTNLNHEKETFLFDTCLILGGFRFQFVPTYSNETQTHEQHCAFKYPCNILCDTFSDQFGVFAMKQRGVCAHRITRKLCIHEETYVTIYRPFTSKCLKYSDFVVAIAKIKIERKKAYAALRPKTSITPNTLSSYGDR